MRACSFISYDLGNALLECMRCFSVAILHRLDWFHSPWKPSSMILAMAHCDGSRCGSFSVCIHGTVIAPQYHDIIMMDPWYSHRSKMDVRFRD